MSLSPPSEFEQTVRAGEQISALIGAVARADGLPAADAAALLRPCLTDIEWLRAAIADQVAAMAHNPLHLPPVQAMQAGRQRHLVLARTPRISVAITIIGAGDGDGDDRAPIHFSGRWTISRVLPMASLSARRYRLDASGLARFDGVLTAAPDAIVEMDERDTAFRAMPGDRPVLLLRAQILGDERPLARSFDPVSGRCVARSSRDETAARALMLLSLLRISERRDATAQFDAETRADAPHQRWAAMREFLALDTCAALPRLQQIATCDPDAELRHLAAQTLAQAGGVPCPA